MLTGMGNLTMFTEFLLMDMSSSRELQVWKGLLFLIIYLGDLAGNLVTFTVIVNDTPLHFPMYFLIGNLSWSDFGYISVTVPKCIINSLIGSELTSLTECAAQTFLFIFFGSPEFFPVITSYDHYIAICHPLYYGLTMTPCLCTQVAGVSWASGLFYSAVHTGTMFRLPFTESNVIHQFFCDIPQVLSISSQEVQFPECVTLAVSACIVLLCSVILFSSYIHIFSAVFQMRSAEARNKALSTCSTQIAIFILFVMSALFAYLGPISHVSTIQNLLTAMFYSMVPPFANPIIFSLRNREIKSALGRMFIRMLHFPKRICMCV